MRVTRRHFYFVGTVIVVIAFVAPFAVRWLRYGPSARYRGFEAPSPVYDPVPVLAQSIPLPAAPSEVDAGAVLIDRVHLNGFETEELTGFVAKLNDRGGRVEYLAAGEDLESRLRGVDAFVIAAAHKVFNPGELGALERFVARGGRLLLVADPTFNEDVAAMNSVAGRFGVVYQGDYLYNVVHNAGNFRNVIFHDFADTALLDGVEQVVFFTAHVIRVADGGFIFGDENTYASRNELPGNVVAAAMPAAANGQVVALPDLTFLTSPYNGIADNNRFIDNLCDWLVTAPRRYVLTDYPYFLQGEVQLVFDDPMLLDARYDDALTLRALLADYGIDAQLRDAVQPGMSSITVGLYDRIDPALRELFIDAGIAITGVREPIAPGTDPADVPLAATGEGGDFAGGQIYLAGIGTFERAGATFVHLYHDAAGDVYRLIILAGDADALEGGLATLAGGRLDRCALTEYTAVCQGAHTHPDAASAEADAVSAAPAVLVFDDDEGVLADEDGADTQTACALAIADTLAGDYAVTVWRQTEYGSPSLDELLGFDAVIWHTGIYIEDAPAPEDTYLLAEYVKQGGRLFVTGAYVGAQTGDAEFYGQVLGAEYAGEDELTGIQPAAGHPIAAGFDTGAAVELDAPLVTDQVQPRAPARVVFTRAGDPDSAAVIAAAHDGARVVYAAMPVTRLPAEARATLVQNVVAWLLSE